MTVAIALVCNDGVLVASDSMGSNQMVATTAVKVHAFQNNPVAWTSSGSVYVVEEVAVALSAGPDNKTNYAFTTPRPPELRTNLKNAVHPAMQQCYGSALASTPVAAGHVAANFATNFLFVGYANKTPWLLEFSHDGQLNWHTDERFYAVGSGGQFASVCHGLMKHHLTDDLTLELGTQLAYRAIDTTCEVSSMLVGKGVQIAVVDKTGQRVLSTDEVTKVGTAVDRWKESERDTFRELHRPTPELEGLPVMDALESDTEEATG